MARHRVSCPGAAGLAVLLLSAGLLAGPAAAGGLDDARSRGKLLVGVRTDFPPFGTIDSRGKPAGYDIDVARNLAKALFEDENRLETVVVTAGSRIPFLYSEWIDMIIAAMTVTEERRQVLEFSDPYFLTSSLLLVPADSSLRGIADLDGKTVAVVEGSVQQQDLPRLAPGARLSVFKTVGAAARTLVDKAVDALAQDETVVRELAEKLPGLKTAGKPFLPRPYAIAVRKGDTDTLRWINEKLAAMKRDGTLERLRRRYFGEPGREGKTR